MFGTTELVIIFGMIVFILGPAKLPAFAKSLGSAIAEFKNASKKAEKELEEIKKE